VDACCDGRADALLGAALRHPGRVRVRKEQTYSHADARLVGEESDDSAVLGEEQGGVDEDVDLPLGAGE
jgi:hypothetical protein